jgi:hypothetical protein
MSARTLGLLVAGLLSSCTMTFHRDERERAPFVPASERPAVALEVVERRTSHGHGNSVVGFGLEQSASEYTLERLRKLWESSGAFERVDSQAHRGVGSPGLDVRLCIVRDEISRSPTDLGYGAILLSPVLLPLLYVTGVHTEVRIVWEARFERAGQVLGEVTRAERLSCHSHWLFFLPALEFTEERAQHDAEEDLLLSILVEARRRGIL